MDGNKYEKRIASYLRNRGYRRVSITKTSGDYGVDIIAYKGFHKYAVQCKYYSKPVGIAAVQQVVAGMAYYECDRAIVITNSSFTRQAIQLAEHNNVELIDNVSPYNAFITEMLLRICGVAGLVLLYKLDQKVIVYLILFIAFILLCLGIYLRSVINSEDDDEVEEESEEFNDK